MSRQMKFLFVEDIDRFASENSDLVEIPAGIADKTQLMQVFVRAVPLPAYFGGNWDALDECFRDRLLDDQLQPLCLLHHDLPLNQDPGDCADYLILLDDTLSWSFEHGCHFAIIFPVAAAARIGQLLGEDA